MIQAGWRKMELDLQKYHVKSFKVKNPRVGGQAQSILMRIPCLRTLHGGTYGAVFGSQPLKNWKRWAGTLLSSFGTPQIWKNTMELMRFSGACEAPQPRPFLK